MIKDLHRAFYFTHNALQLLHRLCATHDKQKFLEKTHRAAEFLSHSSSKEAAIAERFKKWILSYKNFSSLEPTLNTFICDYAESISFLEESLQIQLSELNNKIRFNSESHAKRHLS